MTSSKVRIERNEEKRERKKKEASTARKVKLFRATARTRESPPKTRHRAISLYIPGQSLSYSSVAASARPIQGLLVQGHIRQDTREPRLQHRSLSARSDKERISLIPFISRLGVFVGAWWRTMWPFGCLCRKAHPGPLKTKRFVGVQLGRHRPCPTRIVSAPPSRRT